MIESPGALVGTFGSRVQQLRTVAGITQAELCKLARLHRGHVWQIEQGNRENPEADTVRGLCEVLAATSDWLLFGRGDAPSDADVIAAVEAARSRTSATGTEG